MNTPVVLFSGRSDQIFLPDFFKAELGDSAKLSKKNSSDKVSSVQKKIWKINFFNLKLLQNYTTSKKNRAKLK